MSTESYEAAMAAQAAMRQQLARELQAHLAGRKRFVFEVGCGHGHYLNAFAQVHPQLHCIGIDLITRRVEKSLSKADKRELSNVHFFKASLDHFVEVLESDVRFDAVFMLFPDPWPKKRHHKNRMIQASMLSRLARYCDAGTPFYFRTDHKDYFDWTVEKFSEHPDWELDSQASWVFETPTFFQNLMGDYQSLIARRRG